MPGGDESAEDVSVALDGRGDAFAVWQTYTGSTFVVEASRRPAGGSWEAPVVVSTEETPGIGHPQLAVDERGDAIAIWNRGGPVGGPIQAAYLPAGGGWQPPIDIAQEEAYGDGPLVAFNADGGALAVWTRYAGGNEWRVESASMPAGGSWQAPSEVSGPGYAGGLDFAVNGGGDAAAVWDQWTEGFPSWRTVQSAFMPAGGAWEAPVDIVGAFDEMDQPKDAGAPAVALDGHGDEVAVWAWEFGDTFFIQAAVRSGGGTWQEPVDLSSSYGWVGDPDVAFDARGDTMVVWGGSQGIESAFKPAGGAWQAPTDISGQSGGAAQVAFDERGDALTGWEGERGVEAAGYADGGPVLSDVSIPATGTVGQPVAFAVSPFDVWSIGEEPGWSFGDGASANGTSVTHVYTTPGTYEVTVRSADTLGNVTSTSGTITIVPEAPPQPTPASPSSESKSSLSATSLAAMRPSIAVMTSRLVVANGKTSVRIACGRVRCKGSLMLVMPAAAAGRTHERGGNAAAAGRATVVLATGWFSLSQRTARTVVLHLTAAGRKRLGHGGSITAQLVLSTQGGGTVSRPVGVLGADARHPQ